MRHRVGADFLRDFDLLLRNQRPRDRGPEQILPFVQRVRAEHRENVLAHKLLAQIFDEDVLRFDAEEERLVARGRELLALPEIGRKGHDLAAISGLQPLQDDGGVEPAGIGQHHFLDVTHVAVALRHPALQPFPPFMPAAAGIGIDRTFDGAPRKQLAR
jgi:hypothetical protein